MSSSMGIRLGVDWREVAIAKTHVVELNEQLLKTSQVEDINILPGIDGANEAIKDVEKEINRLRGIAMKGEKSGGILNKADFREAAKLAKAIGRDFASYQKSLAGAEAQLERLVSKRVELRNAREKSWRKTEQKDLDNQIRDVDRKINKLSTFLDRSQTRSATLHSKATEATDNISKMRTASVPAHLGKKAMGLGMALVGGFTVAGMASDAMRRSIGYSVGSADLLMRHDRKTMAEIAKNQSTFGYGSMRDLNVAEQVSSGVGYGGKQLADLVESTKKFSRSLGLQVEQVAGYVAGNYQATGADAARYDRLLREIRGAIKENHVDGRASEFLQTNRELIQMVHKGRGGVPLTEDETTRLIQLQAAVWNKGGLTGQGESGMQLLGNLDRGIRSGGSNPGQQMFMLNALTGGHVDGLKGFWEYEKTKQRGLLGSNEGVSNIQRVIDYSKEAFGTDKKGRLSVPGMLNLVKTFGLTPEQAELVVTMEKEGAFKGIKTDKDAKRVRQRILKRSTMDQDATRRMKTPGGKHEQVMADIEKFKIGIGEPMLQAIDKFKGTLVSAANEIASAFGLKKDDKSTIAGRMRLVGLLPSNKKKEEGDAATVAGRLSATGLWFSTKPHKAHTKGPKRPAQDSPEAGFMLPEKIRLNRADAADKDPEWVTGARAPQNATGHTRGAPGGGEERKASSADMGRKDEVEQGPSSPPPAFNDMKITVGLTPEAERMLEVAVRHDRER